MLNAIKLSVIISNFVMPNCRGTYFCITKRCAVPEHKSILKFFLRRRKNGIDFFQFFCRKKILPKNCTTDGLLLLRVNKCQTPEKKIDEYFQWFLTLSLSLSLSQTHTHTHILSLSLSLSLTHTNANTYCIEGTEMRQLGFKVRRLLFLNRY